MDQRSQSSPSSTPKESRYFLTRSPDFFLIWIGQIFSQSGGRMYQIALIWWILSSASTGTGKLVGLFMVMTALPSIGLVKKIGQLVDVVYSKKILVCCDLIACILLAGVAFALRVKGMPLPAVFFVGLIAASLQAFIDPTLNKSVAEVVEPGDVESAVALLSATQSLANFTGASREPCSSSIWGSREPLGWRPAVTSLRRPLRPWRAFVFAWPVLLGATMGFK